MPDIRKAGTEVKISGLHNLIFLAMIIVAVILSSVLPNMELFQNADGSVIGLPIYGDVVLTVPAVIEIAIILLAAFL